MIAHFENRQLWPALFELSRALLITAAQRLSNACIELWYRTFESLTDFGERPFG